MQVDIEHVLFWMDAIRNSDDKYRTLESFWKGQVHSKIWLIKNLKPFVTTPSSIDIVGGWNGVLASLLFQSDLPVKEICSIDIDPSCQSTAVMMNKGEEIAGKFYAITADMCDVCSDADVIINTSCEHITQNQYDCWLSNIPNGSLLVLQSNNYIISEHVRTATSLEEFVNQSKINVIWKGELELPNYTRYMLIGTPNETR
jgi:hypothetical protein